MPEGRDGPEVPPPAWYAAGPGPARQWITVLHPPYTAWHLAYVLIGAGLAPHIDGKRLAATVIAFALAVGVAAHALDEMRGRPLGTTIPSRVLGGAAAVSLIGAVALGAVGIHQVGWGLAAFVAVGVILVVGYNLELWGGILHNDHVFAVAWGVFPLWTAYYAQAATLRPAALVGGAFAFGLSRAQRVLSTSARNTRRRVTSVAGEQVFADGSRQEITRASLLRPVEQSLAALSWSTCLLGLALVLARTHH